MPYTLKPNKLFAKDPNGDGYLPQNVVTEQSTAEQVELINSTGSAQVSAIQTKGAETLDSIPDDYTALQGEVDGLESVVSDLESLDNAPAIIETASGAIASFDDGADDRPMKSLVAHIEPVQDLHGYDHPWPAGGGKNLLKNNLTSQTQNGITVSVDDFGVITITGTASANTSFTINSSIGIGPGSYVINGITSPSALSYKLEAQIDGAWGNNFISGDKAVTVSTEITSIVLYIYSGTAFTTATVVKPMIRKATDTDATFVPYSNICPISGWTAAKVTRTGINIWDEEYQIADISGATGLQVEGNYICSKNFIPVIPNGTYAIASQNEQGTTARRWVVYYYDAEQKLLDWNSFFNLVQVFQVPLKCRYIKFRNNQTSTTYNHDISINYPSTDIAYHPGHAQTYEVTFPTEAGTVYGGELTVNEDGTGNLVVDKYSVDPTAWSRYNANNGYVAYRIENIPYAKYQTPISNQAVSNVLATFGSFSSSNMNRNIIQPPTTTSNIAYLALQEDLDPVALGMQLVYLIATPVTYTLTVTQVRTILGTNNVWADTGDVTVEYRADTKLYIDHKIAELQALILENNG